MRVASQQPIEPRVRRLVAETLGVCPTELGPEIQLMDDLAADSLDIVELAVELEGEFGITFSERMLGHIRSYADLVEATFALAHGPRFRGLPGVFAWSHVVPPNAEPGTGLERSAWLTPYVAQEIAEDALQCGRGTRLDLWLPVGTDDTTMARVIDRFAWLHERGVRVTVHRGRPSGERRAPVPAPEAQGAAA
jgi:acyl carrier protein